MSNRSSDTDRLFKPAPKKILLVDDRDDVRITTKWFLNNFGYVVDSVPNAEKALLVFNPSVHQLVITDNRMPGISGSELASKLKEISPGTPIVMYTGQPPESVSAVDVVLQRPTHLLALKETVDRLLAVAVS